MKASIQYKLLLEKPLLKTAIHHRLTGKGMINHAVFTRYNPLIIFLDSLEKIKRSFFMLKKKIYLFSEKEKEEEEKFTFIRKVLIFPYFSFIKQIL